MRRIIANYDREVIKYETKLMHRRKIVNIAVVW